MAKLTPMELAALDLSKGDRQWLFKNIAYWTLAVLGGYLFVTAVSWATLVAWWDLGWQLIEQGFFAAVAFAEKTSWVFWFGGYVALAIWAGREHIMLRTMIKLVGVVPMDPEEVSSISSKYMHLFWLRSAICGASSVVCVAYPMLIVVAACYYIFLELSGLCLEEEFRKKNKSNAGTGDRGFTWSSRYEREAYNAGYMAGRRAHAPSSAHLGLASMAYDEGYSAGSKLRQMLCAKGMSPEIGLEPSA